MKYPTFKKREDLAEETEDLAEENEDAIEAVDRALASDVRILEAFDKKAIARRNLRSLEGKNAKEIGRSDSESEEDESDRPPFKPSNHLSCKVPPAHSG